MGLYDMKAYYRWLDEATDDELNARREALLEALSTKFSEISVVNDARKLLHLIEREILDRLIKQP